jgi:cell wall-associated NlpC family hydrolase
MPPDADASLACMTISARCGAVVLVLLAAGVCAGCGGAKVGGGTSNATTTATSDPPDSASSGVQSGAPGSRSAAPQAHAGAIREVADPEEANSFPAPASANHARADAPVKAGEAAVAPGAPSDSEVREELKQMQAAERSAKRASRTRLTPVPGGESIGGSGALPIPSGVPETIQKVIAGANEIADFPYVFGGGHASFIDNAYDCSGSVSYALAAGGLISSPETSGELEHWGAPGPGRYITVFANAGHAYMYVDGILFDTAGRSGVYASRWQVIPTDNSGFVARHPPGL